MTSKNDDVATGEPEPAEPVVHARLVAGWRLTG